MVSDKRDRKTWGWKMTPCIPIGILEYVVAEKNKGDEDDDERNHSALLMMP